MVVTIRMTMMLLMMFIITAVVLLFFPSVAYWAFVWDEFQLTLKSGSVCRISKVFDAYGKRPRIAERRTDLGGGLGAFTEGKVVKFHTGGDTTSSTKLKFHTGGDTTSSNKLAEYHLVLAT